MKHWAIIITIFLALCGSTSSANTGASEDLQGQAAPPGWSEVLRQTLDLTLAGKHTEMIVLVEKWVARYPNFPEARMMLGAAHENIGRDVLTSGAADAVSKSARHYETAVVHFRRGVELPGADFSTMRALIDVHGLIGLNRPAEYERLVHAGLKRYPADPAAHVYLIDLLAGKQTPLDGAVRAALAALPKGPDARATVAGMLYQSSTEPYQTGAAAMLRAALQFTEEALKTDPAHRDALRNKERILQEQARQSRLPKR